MIVWGRQSQEAQFAVRILAMAAAGFDAWAGQRRRLRCCRLSAFRSVHLLSSFLQDVICGSSLQRTPRRGVIKIHVSALSYRGLGGASGKDVSIATLSMTQHEDEVVSKF